MKHNPRPPFAPLPESNVFVKILADADRMRADQRERQERQLARLRAQYRSANDVDQ